MGHKVNPHGLRAVSYTHLEFSKNGYTDSWKRENFSKFAKKSKILEKSQKKACKGRFAVL